LNESIHAANSSSEQATRMAEIRNETGILADRHEKEAETITKKANETLNKSQQAFSATEEAVDAQEKTSDGIEELLKKLNKTITLHERVASAVNKSRDDSQSALDEANELYKNGTAPLPDLGLSEMQATLNTSKEEVANATDRAQEILDVLESLVESFNMKEEDVRKKMAEWPGLFGRLEGLLANVTNANNTAHDAIARGEETLRKAKDMLERLKKFNEVIDSSRAEAERAEANIPEIERLINSANNKSDEASGTLGDAQESAEKAQSTAERAQDTAERTREKAEKIRKEAEELEIPEDNVTLPVSQANEKLTGYKQEAKDQAEDIASALNKTKTAGVAATKARDKIQEVLEKLVDLLKGIDDLGIVNGSKLDHLEEQLLNETDKDRQLDREIIGVEKQSEIIKNTIILYTINLEKLRATKEVLEERYKKLPKVCPRETPGIEQG